MTILVIGVNYLKQLLKSMMTKKASKGVSPWNNLSTKKVNVYFTSSCHILGFYQNNSMIRYLGSKVCYASSSVNQLSVFYTITISQEPLAKRTWNVLLPGCAMKASIWMHPMLRMSSSVWSSARPTTTATGSPTLHSWPFASCYTTAQC